MSAAVEVIVDSVGTKRLATEDDSEAKRPRIDNDRVRRKKMAMLLAYCGQGYFGMQRNPETKTIEEDLFTALLKAGYITEEAFSAAQTIQFQRAARTDKGVSAARQVVSLKLPDEVKVERINEHLPSQIRTFAIKRTTKGFNCKSACNARSYSYMTPTFAFAPHDQELDKSYRITPEVLSVLRSTLKLFEGTHNFHNFTSKKKPGDPSAIRYMMDISCDQPVISEDIEFMVLRIKGQSFMLHQIRKMIGLAIAVVRGLTSSETITRAWSSDRLDIPMAPGLGLVLDEVHYERYDQRYGGDGIHEKLTWEEQAPELEAFYKQFIQPTIVKTEISEESMLTWLLTLPLHTYDVREIHRNHTSEPQHKSPDSSTVVSQSQTSVPDIDIERVNEANSDSTAEVSHSILGVNEDQEKI